MNPRRTPERIRSGHRSNQGAALGSDGRPPRPVPALPRPEETKPSPMPRDDRFGFDDDERGAPLPPHSRQANPEQTVEAGQPKPTPTGSFKDLQLMAQCEDLELQGRARTAAISKRREEGAED